MNLSDATAQLRGTLTELQNELTRQQFELERQKQIHAYAQKMIIKQHKKLKVMAVAATEAYVYLGKYKGQPSAAVAAAETKLKCALLRVTM